MENDTGLYQAQKLAMTQQMRQAIKILQLSSYELNEYLKDQQMSNPMLEMRDVVEEDSIEAAVCWSEAKSQEEADIQPQIQGHGIEWKEYFNASDYSNHDHFYYETNDIEYNVIERIPYEDTTLTDYLMLQLNTAVHNKKEYRIAKAIIEAIDESGYLTLSAEEIASETGAGVAETKRMIREVQRFDPPGIGSASLEECLLIQIEQLSQTEYSDFDLELPKMIIQHHLEDLAGNRLANITRALHISTQEAQEACDFIKTLEPRPGRNFIQDGQTKYIIPDIVIEQVDGKFVINISENAAPRLRINRFYKKYLLNKGGDRDKDRAEEKGKTAERDKTHAADTGENDGNDEIDEIVKYLHEKLNSAMWLIRSVEQRRKTIYRLVEAILSNQRDFFEKGKANLKSLTLKQVAEEIGMHISTVSRAANGKYLQCRFGVFELKYFFDSGVSGNSEQRVSSKGIQEMIVNIIKLENAKKPFSDRQIADELSSRGIELSRRTIAKYRAVLEIQSSSKRKRY
ncbi:MAG: RNA polymerase factor sigma-54 [Oscillospiraceae bacterium]|nr:RNA polymerase factor sigma-54 [Oscillospiraceae bacterium]